MRFRGLNPSVLASLVVFLAPTAVQACAVCFGRTDSPLGKGLHWGVFVLLGMIGLVLAAVSGFAVFLARRSLAAERDQAVAESAVDGGEETPRNVNQP